MCLCLQTREPHTGKSIEKRRNELILNRTKLLSYMRKRTSARNNWKTSRIVIVSIVAVIILVMYGVLLDLFALISGLFLQCVIQRWCTETTQYNLVFNVVLRTLLTVKDLNKCIMYSCDQWWFVEINDLKKDFIISILIISNIVFENIKHKLKHVDLLGRRRTKVKGSCSVNWPFEEKCFKI